MPLDIDLNGVEKRLEVTKELSTLNISEYSVIHIRDWESLVITKRNPDLKDINQLNWYYMQLSDLLVTLIVIMVLGLKIALFYFFKQKN